MWNESSVKISSLCYLNQFYYDGRIQQRFCQEAERKHGGSVINVGMSGKPRLTIVLVAVVALYVQKRFVIRKKANNERREQVRHSLLSLSHHLQILINSWSTQSTNPRQLTHIHLTRSKGRIVLIENGRDVILGCLGSAHMLALLLGIRHA